MENTFQIKLIKIMILKMNDGHASDNGNNYVIYDYNNDIEW